MEELEDSKERMDWNKTETQANNKPSNSCV